MGPVRPFPAGELSFLGIIVRNLSSFGTRSIALQLLLSFHVILPQLTPIFILRVDHMAVKTGSHHDVAEIVIPGICGLIVVVLVAGLLYYRNRYQLLLRRYSFRSRLVSSPPRAFLITSAIADYYSFSAEEIRNEAKVAFL